MLRCATKMHFLTKHIKLYTQTIPFVLLNNVNFIPNNFLQKFFKVLTLRKTLSFDKPHLYLWPNKCFQMPNNQHFGLRGVIAHYHT
jgi:hypothetical protein